jgi:hypothetical protein
VIPGRLPGLNELLDARANVVQRGRNGARWNKYSDLKRQVSEKIALLARAQEFNFIKGGFFSYLFIEKDRRRDPSNFVSAGLKIIEDALQMAGLLAGDGWNEVDAFDATWKVGLNPGVILLVASGAINIDPCRFEAELKVGSDFPKVRAFNRDCK